MKKDIRAYSKDELRAFFTAKGQEAFRGNQVYEWLWKKGVHTFDEMTNISQETRAFLDEYFTINHIAVDDMQRSNDGTVKNAVTLFDGLVVESVLIPTDSRTTACVSSQVGCAMGCTFCATSRLKKQRNLNLDEIYDQVAAINRQSELYYGHKLNNIVFMGMGEPLLNYDNMMKAIDKITSEEGLGMSPRRITVSTVGIPKMIKRMTDEKVKFNLAISLHSAIDKVRSSMMPINESSNLDELMESLQYWHNNTGNRITFEYIVWKDINDTQEAIDALVAYCRRVPAKVNLIEYNPIDDGKFQQAPAAVTDKYIAELERNHIIVNVRRSRGKDIDAACGQLANKTKTMVL